ncbi:penicillin-insensitive murein endopeptidase [Mesorhizobium sp. L-8-10]|uniref:penicillin-insensitive murein endopeptidase n=1 Tax=Mesorhizobium sp. L-8-10 TaxID=2744523 RepID=UPI001926C77F|nr:penicillin-insensitive murein endopeptidase [Mesorhizobium sp. L-8-10]BCH29136.1 penicillin-insensitive murein endopeptidase [Mesorhizobium sp. L-8-10]
MTPMQRLRRLTIGGSAAIAALAMLPAPASSEQLAKNLFGSQKLPAATAARSYGFYSKGCFSGGVAIATDGPAWQAMRLSRNRRWGHPTMINLIEKLSREARKDGWPGLLLGDISQPRGGPMLTGHASHQIGLDADVWLTPMPSRRLSASERENMSATSVIRKGGLTVDERLWTPAHARLLQRAASYPEVERILVHPGIKKKLCDTVTGDRSWLRKIRPFWGHDYHFHIRIGCQPGSSGCKEQEATPRGDGCDKSLAWWFTEEPWRPNKNPDKPKARDIMTMASLPRECRAVLEAPSPVSEAAVTVGGDGTALAAAPSRELEQSGTAAIAPAAPPVAASAYAPDLGRRAPIPQPRPRVDP